MAAYCTQADLVERFGVDELAQLTDETAAASPDSVEIAKVCDEATSLIDGYLASQYQLPLSAVPVIVRKWACDIARFFLWKDRADSTSVVRLNYEDALKSVTNVAKGIVFLPGADGIEPDDSNNSIAVVSATKVFDADVLAAMPGSRTYRGAYWRDFLR